MLTVENVQAYYDTAHILDGTSLEVADGEVLGLLGRNGMGKTTLVRTIAGVAPPRQADGTITWQGEDITNLESYEIARRGIGYVPQGRRVFGSLSVIENLDVIAREPAHDMGEAWTIERVFSFFPRLEERKTSYARTLSGGEQQMLAIGRALMTNPRLLVLDEATEGLAPLVRESIWSCLRTIKDAGMAILIVDKHIEALARFADRHVIIEKGRTVWSGDSEALLASDDVKDRYLHI